MEQEQIKDIMQRLNGYLFCGEQLNRWGDLKAEYTSALEWLNWNLPEGVLKVEEEDGSRSWGVTVQGSRIPLIFAYNEGKNDFYFIIESI